MHAFALAVALASNVASDVNSERQTHGVATLLTDPCLSAVAQVRAADMVRRDYFAHQTPDGRMPWDIMRAQGCAFRDAGENIAEAPSLATAISALWESTEHRANTLDPQYTRIGVGIASRADGTLVVVEDFAN